MDKKTDKLVKDFISSVAQENLNFITAYLFGSYAKGQQGSNSDIAVIIEDLNDNKRFDTQVHLMLLASQFDTRIEPHPFSLNDFHPGNAFAAEIIKTGIEIKPEAIG